MRQIHEELRSAEILEGELEKRLKAAEKPAIMSFAEKLEDCQGLEEDFVEETFGQVEDPDEIISVLREREKRLHIMNRSQLLGFIKTVLVVRDCLLERDKAEGVNTTQVCLSHPHIYKLCEALISILLRKSSIGFRPVHPPPPPPPTTLTVSQLPVVRSEHLRTLFDSTQPQES